MKKGFTIVELLMVIGIIAVLMGIITTAASSSIKQSRARKTDVLCQLVEAGLATYYEQRGQWPASIPTSSDPKDDPQDPDQIVFDGKAVQSFVRELVKESASGNPMMDISGLFVSRSQGEKDSGPAYGLDFMQAVRGTKKSPKRMTLGEMYFGYPDEETGWFRRFKMVYSVPSDTIRVMKQNSDSKK